MKTHQITINLTDVDYNLLQETAHASGWSLTNVVEQCIQVGMPPTLSKVPEPLHADLISLNSLPDIDLLKVADGDWPAPKNLTELQRKADFITLRRTYALSLLKWRGHPISPEDAML